MVTTSTALVKERYWRNMKRKKKLESHLQVPSLLFSGTVSSLHLPSSMPFSFRGFSIEDSVLARLFLGVFVLEDIFFKFTGRGLMRVLLQCWFKHDCAISQAVHEQYLSHKSHCISLLTIHISYMHLIRFHAYYVCTKGTNQKHTNCKPLKPNQKTEPTNVENPQHHKPQHRTVSLYFCPMRRNLTIATAILGLAEQFLGGWTGLV